MIDFSTASLAAADGREAWNSHLAALCGRPATLQFERGQFAASIRTAELGGINVVHLAHNVREIAQDKREIEDTSCGHLMLFLQLKGRAVVSQGGQDVEVGADELGLLDTYRPFVSRFSGATRQLAVYVPAAELKSRHAASLFSQPKCWSSESGVAQLLRANLIAIARSAERFDAADGDYAREMLTGLLHHLLERDRGLHASPPVRQPEHRIRAFIDARLSDPELGPLQIAAGCSISLRKLHRSFSQTPWSVCSWIRHRRLERCRRALLDPAFRNLSITQIAFRFGFNEAAHFSRSFKDSYGQSPREARRCVSVPM